MYTHASAAGTQNIDALNQNLPGRIAKTLHRCESGRNVEALRASPVKTTGVQTPDLVACVQDGSAMGWN
jgi:hypothetical protein